jgi:hypothetical protein
LSDFPLKRKYWKGAGYLPPVPLWKRYVGEVARRYRGKISHYEIMNEPNLIFHDSSDYLVYLKAAYEEIKAADPAAKVVGLCCTGDLGGNVQGFLKDALEQGAAEYCDVISFHPYNAANLSTRLAADRQIESLRKLIRRYTDKEIPLWNTELYFLTGKGRSNAQKGVAGPQDVAKRFLIDLGEGLGQSITVTQSSLWTYADSPHIHFDFSRFMPSSKLVACNALARLFQGAKPVEKLRLPGDVICYVFQQHGTYRAALWTYGTSPDVQATLAFGEDEPILYDLFGNPMPLSGKTLTLTSAPVYLESKSGDLAGFLRTLRSVGAHNYPHEN